MCLRKIRIFLHKKLIKNFENWIKNFVFGNKIFISYPEKYIWIAKHVEDRKVLMMREKSSGFFSFGFRFFSFVWFLRILRRLISFFFFGPVFESVFLSLNVCVCVLVDVKCLSWYPIIHHVLQSMNELYSFIFDKTIWFEFFVFNWMNWISFFFV